MKLTILSPAKLNLFLHVTGRRVDGYHTLQTYFQLLDVGDRLTFKKLNSSALELKNPLPHVPNEKNLIIRAAQLLQAHTHTTLGVSIEVEKKIPMGAGLGGGSSNAGTTLLALNYLWKTGCDTQTLMHLASQLGADVPLFVLRHSAWGEGIGEQLTPMAQSQMKWFLIVTPPVHVATASIFQHPELTRNTPHITVAAFRKDTVCNSCEPLVCRLYPEVHETLAWLRSFGQARLTGTGASCFLVCSSEKKANQLQQQVPRPWTSFVAKAVSEVPFVELNSR